jgi:hypothetical protein
MILLPMNSISVIIICARSLIVYVVALNIHLFIYLLFIYFGAGYSVIHYSLPWLVSRRVRITSDISS